MAGEQQPREARTLHEELDALWRALEALAARLDITIETVKWGRATRPGSDR